MVDGGWWMMDDDDTEERRPLMILQKIQAAMLMSVVSRIGVDADEE